VATGTVLDVGAHVAVQAERQASNSLRRPQFRMGSSSGRSRWRPGVRLILVVVVLLPMLATGLFAGSRLVGASTSRAQAKLVARDAARLQMVASARVQLNIFAVPLEAVAYAGDFGLSISVMDALLLPDVPYAEQLTQVSSAIEAFPVFESATLRDDVTRLRELSEQVATNTTSYTDARTFMARMELDVDNLWDATYDQLQADIAAWRSPGSFGLHASTLTQTYQAFLSGGRLLDGTAFVLQGVADADTRQELFEANGAYQVAIDQFAGHLGPRAQAAWEALLANPANQQFEATIEQALTVALTGDPSPFAGTPAGAGAAMAPALKFLTDVDSLVVAASHDLQDAALAQAADATVQFDRDAILVIVLAIVVVVGVIVAAQVLIRPLRRLAAHAQQVHGGNFDLDHLAETGPRETVDATGAFNEMASTLKGIETRAVALAAEDFSHPDLFIPLPGRTGHALQATIDALAARIRERERQRLLLHEDATHDNATGLLNRAAVMDYLTTDVARRRQAGETVAVLFLDLDGLKYLNDTYGHEFGDSAIKATADSILDATDICDVVGRLGGDEFLVVLCHEHSGDGDTIAARVNASLSRRSLTDGDEVIPLRASVGIALARCDADTDPLTLVRQADAAMYIAKRAARATRDQLARRLPL
jgi:diguanylate cyclase (GGDEF)-like protein